MGINKIIIILVCLILTSCTEHIFSLPGFGIVYSDYKIPFDTDFDKTPIGSKQVIMNEFKLSDPYYTNVSAEWAIHGDVDTAKIAGFSKLYNADQGMFGFLGIFSNTRLYLYGD